jgi:hypothetical protein
MVTWVEYLWMIENLKRESGGDLCKEGRGYKMTQLLRQSLSDSSCLLTIKGRR